MSAPLWVGELAEQFWAATGEPPPPFRRDLRLSVLLGLPLAIMDLPRLRLAAVDDWLVKRGYACRLAAADRPLRACLVAYRGCNVVFLDGADPPSEQRYSLAHEVAHFLVDYWRPRERAVARLGPAVLQVLDGERPPTVAERIDATLASLPLAPHVHLMDRTPDGHAASAREDAAERHADLLALELLAPRAAVATALAEGRGAPPGGEGVTALLVERFGLPPAVAAAYAAEFAPRAPATSPFLRRLGFEE